MESINDINPLRLLDEVNSAKNLKYILDLDLKSDKNLKIMGENSKVMNSTKKLKYINSVFFFLNFNLAYKFQLLCVHMLL